MRNLNKLSFFAEDANDYQDITGEAEQGCNDDAARREDVGIEGLLRAARPRHQQVADGDEDAGDNEDAATGQQETEETSGVICCGVHIDECIVDKWFFFQTVRPRRVPVAWFASRYGGYILNRHGERV